MFRPPLVSVIVLNWNDAETTLSCLESLLEQTPIPLIIVCDNGSSDCSPNSFKLWAASHNLAIREIHTITSEDILQDPPPDLYLLRNATNLGFSGGNNPGIRLALELGSSFVWILNNDTRLSSHALSSLLDCSHKQPRVGIIGATIINMKNPEILQIAGGCRYQPITTLGRPIHKGRNIQEIEYLSDEIMNYVYGASFFVRSSVFKDIGLFNEHFFMFYEELDFCQRAIKAGYDLFWCRQAVIEHLGGHSINKMDNKDKEFQENFSTVLYTRIHHPNLLVPALIIRFFAKLFFLTIRRHPGHIMIVWKAYLEGLRRKLT